MTRHRVARVLLALAAATALVAGTATMPAAGSTRGRVFIKTSPALAGVQLRVGPSVVITGSDGTASVTVPDLNGIASRVSLATRAPDTRTRLSLAHVKPAPHAAAHESHLTVGLDVSSKVRLRISGGRTGVDPRTVHAVKLHSVTGETRLVDPQHTPTVLLQSRKARLVAGVVTPQVVTWSVDSLRAAPGVSLTTARASFDPLGSPSWSLVLRPVQGTVLVDTVPATPGVTFLLDGASFVTDTNGHATANVADLNGVDLRLGVITHVAAGATVSVLRVSRLKPAAAFQRHLVVALAVSRPVTLRFADPTGRPIPADRISEVRLAGGTRTVRMAGGELHAAVPLVASVARLVSGVWTPQPVTYSAKRVTLDGSNAVFTGQQRFDPGKADQWTITVSVFDISVTVRDVLFGSRVSSGAYVLGPDGTRSTVFLGSHEPTVLRSLVRGEYTLTTRSAVVGGSTNVLVSKASDVELRVVTLLDTLLVLVVLLSLSTLLILLGRRSHRGSDATSAGMS